MKVNLLGSNTGRHGLLVVASLIFASQALLADIIPTNRRITWDAGIPGGIPNRTTIFANVKTAYGAVGDDVHDDTSAIQSALNACPANQVVYIPSGTYRVSSVLKIPQSITVRGDGPGKTIIDAYSGAYSGAITFGNDNWPNFNNAVSFSGGLNAGSTSLTLGSTAGVSVGSYLLLTEQNDTSFVTAAGFYGACNWCDGGQTANGSRALGQIVEVTSVNGTTVGISPGLYWTYSSSLAPTAVPFNANIKYAGVESLTVRCNHTGYHSNFRMSDAAYCWLKNVEGDYTDGDHVDVYWSYRCEIRDSFFHDAFTHAPGSSDADVMLADKTSACLVENNIIWRLHAGIMLNWGAAGNVIGYNFLTNMFDSNSTNALYVDLSAHGTHPMFNLWEGNAGVTINPDSGWGSSSHGTIFRNLLAGSGTASPPLNGRGPVQSNIVWTLYQQDRVINLDSESWYYNVVGNILGSPYYTNHGGIYMAVPPQANGYETPYIFHLGYTTPAGGGESTTTAATTLIHGNWDWVTRTIHWDSTISDHTIPNSLYLSSKPAWFGDRTWPPFDPANPLAGSGVNIPAGYRFRFGTNPPAGGPPNLPPVVVVSATPRNGPAPLTVNFSTAGTADPEGSSVTYNWAFGDGHTSTAANPSNIYNTNGNFNVQLQVSDGVNTTTTNLTITVTIAGQNLPPAASASATPSAGPAPLTVAFSSTGSTDPEGGSLTYNWNFGDGTTSTAANPSKTYNNPGIYTAQLRVSDGTNASAATNLNIIVGDTPPTGLVAAYGFEEGAGGSTADISGNNNVGTINSATWSASGKFGHALTFNTGALITVNDSASLHLSTGMTLEAWVNPSSLSGWMNVLFKPNGSSGIDYVMQGSTSAGSPSLGISPSSTNLSAPSALPLNTWSHLAGTYDGATMKFYVNGLLVASKAQTGTIVSSSDPLTIGGNLLYGENWKGLIDEVRIYSRALSQDEIHGDMNTPVAGPDTRPSNPPTSPRIVGQ
jgi:PKD repeat protein